MSIHPIFVLHTINSITHLFHSPNARMRPFIITIGLPIIPVHSGATFGECPTFLVNQVVLALFDSFGVPHDNKLIQETEPLARIPAVTPAVKASLSASLIELT